MPVHAEPLDSALTHTIDIRNLELIVRQGFIACPEMRVDDHRIWSPEIESRRAERIVHAPSKLTLGGCVSLMVTPRSPAHLMIATGRGVPRVPNERIVHLQTSARVITAALIAIAVADRNALARDAAITFGTGGLATVDWQAVRKGDFSKSINDPTRTARMGAEVLTRGALPFSVIDRVVCWRDDVADRAKSILMRTYVTTEVKVDPDLFFRAGG